MGLKAFLDEEHIAWGETFTRKINVALGAARTVLAIVSSTSVTKDWPLTEVNTALALEVAGDKSVVPLIVGKPDLSRLPLIRGKDYLEWSGDPVQVARKLREVAARYRVDVVRRRARAGRSPPPAACPLLLPRGTRSDAPRTPALVAAEECFASPIERRRPRTPAQLLTSDIGSCEHPFASTFACLLGPRVHADAERLGGPSR